MILRLLDYAAITFVVWFVWTQLSHGYRQAMASRDATAAGGRSGGGAPAAGTAGSAATPANTAILVRCDACGVHVVSGRALAGRSGRVFCSETCRSRAEAPSH